MLSRLVILITHYTLGQEILSVWIELISILKLSLIFSNLLKPNMKGIGIIFGVLLASTLHFVEGVNLKITLSARYFSYHNI